MTKKEKLVKVIEGIIPQMPVYIQPALKTISHSYLKTMQDEDIEKIVKTLKDVVNYLDS